MINKVERWPFVERFMSTETVSHVMVSNAL